MVLQWKYFESPEKIRENKVLEGQFLLQFRSYVRESGTSWQVDEIDAKFPKRILLMDGAKVAGWLCGSIGRVYIRGENPFEVGT